MDSRVERLLQEYREDFCLEDFSREKLICQLLKYDMWRLYSEDSPDYLRMDEGVDMPTLVSGLLSNRDELSVKPRSYLDFTVKDWEEYQKRGVFFERFLMTQGGNFTCPATDRRLKKSSADPFPKVTGSSAPGPKRRFEKDNRKRSNRHAAKIRNIAENGRIPYIVFPKMSKSKRTPETSDMYPESCTHRLRLELCPGCCKAKVPRASSILVHLS